MKRDKQGKFLPYFPKFTWYANGDLLVGKDLRKCRAELYKEMPISKGGGFMFYCEDDIQNSTDEIMKGFMLSRNKMTYKAYLDDCKKRNVKADSMANCIKSPLSV